ncbi:MAG: ATP-binding protein [Bacteroidetes bacterium]|nr:ATP-binding protein [Bacteroidota bacterium]
MQYIRELIAGGESQILEFKFELNSARTISRTISAFSNTQGGTLLVGVKDNGSIAGIRIDEEIYVLEAAASIYCKPAVELKIKQHTIESKLILEVKIPEAVVKPVLSEHEPESLKAFTRIGASNRMASPVHLNLWNSSGSNKKPSEFSEAQMNLLNVFNFKKWLSLNQLCRLSKLPRHVVIQSLADFIRWELIECEPEISGGFVFVLKEDNKE